MTWKEIYLKQEKNRKDWPEKINLKTFIYVHLAQDRLFIKVCS